MKNLKQLCLVLSVGGMTALSIAACGDDTTPTGGTAGTTGTAGTGTAGTGTAGTGTAGTATAGTSSGGTGTAGTASGGTGGASGGSGGASGGSGGSGGASGGSGGASGGSGGSGGGGGGGAPSADCMKWCSGADSVLTVCAGKNIPTKIDSEAKCLSVCAASPAESVTCWNMHTANAKAGDDAAKTTHCPHAEGADGQNVCPKLP